MFAVIQTGGKQYKVSPGKKIKVEKIETEPGKDVVFEKVLLIAEGENAKVGTPFLNGATVSAKALAQGRAKKVTVIKYKPKIRYRKKLGHRQAFTEVEITKITA